MKEYIILFLVLLLILYISTKNVYGVIAVVFLLAVVQYSSWIQTKKHEPFEQRMTDIVKKVNEGESAAIETIPRIIIQVWVQKDGEAPRIPANQVQYMNKFRKMNPTFEHMFFNGDDIDLFFKSNYMEYYDTYKRLPFFIQTLDFFRYLAIYHYGGFYFDMDIEPLKPLDNEILNHSAVFPVDEYASKFDCANNPRMQSFCLAGQNFLLGQYAFAATAKHPFMKYVVDQIHQGLEKYIRISKIVNPEDKDAMHYFVYKTTGPDFITDCYVKYPNKDQLFILSNGKRQMFGNYAEHKYIGLWK